MRRKNRLASMLQSKAPTYIFEPSAHGQGGRGEHSAIQFRPEVLSENGAHVDGSRLQEHILAPRKCFRSRCLFVAPVAASRIFSFGSSRPRASSFDPEDGITVIGFQREPELRLNFLSAPNEGEYLFWFLRYRFQLASETSEGLIEGKEFIAILLEELAPGIEGESAIPGRQQREE